MYFTLTFLPVTCHNLEFTSSFRYQRRRSVLLVSYAAVLCLVTQALRDETKNGCVGDYCIIGLQNLCYIDLFFGSPLCLIMEKMNERSYSDVVSGSGKFIFAVSTGYLFGVCCNLCASDFT